MVSSTRSDIFFYLLSYFNIFLIFIFYRIYFASSSGSRHYFRVKKESIESIERDIEREREIDNEREREIDKERERERVTKRE